VDPEALASRELVARRLVTAMLKAGLARIVLSANDLANASARAELVRLAERLTAAGPEGAVQVRLRTSHERWTLPPGAVPDRPLVVKKGPERACLTGRRHADAVVFDLDQKETGVIGG
jgi:hypothetical protein